MSNTKFSNFKSEDGNTGPDLVGITSFTSPYYFVPPSGTTADRPSNPVPGMLRFNTDSGRLEVWRNDHWATILGESSTLDGGARGVFGGNRNTPTVTSSTSSEYINIPTLGNAINFGDLTLTIALQGSCSSNTRGLFAGGYCLPSSGTGSQRTNKITGWTFSSTGSHVDFSSTIRQTTQQVSGLSNQTRGIFAGGYITSPGTPSGTTNNIDYITIASVGNAVGFGDLSLRKSEFATFASSTRGIFAGGYTAPTNTGTNKIDYITISTTGNAVGFGDLTQAVSQSSGGGNSIRGIRMGGNLFPARSNVIDYVTIATTGNAQDFGDLLVGSISGSQGFSMSSPTRSLYAGGFTNPAITNVIQYITIQSTGNSIDFGDLSSVKSQFAGASNGHGGL